MDNAPLTYGDHPSNKAASKDGVERPTHVSGAHCRTGIRIGTIARAMCLALGGGFGLILGLLSAMPAAHADLRLCNKTDSNVSVAIGYRTKDAWISEGWWNFPEHGCNTLIPGPLGARYYYIYALDSKGGDWGGKWAMCTRPKVFTIRGTEDCIARGYERTGFFEVDTAQQRSWTVNLTEPTRTEGAANQ